MTASQQGRRPWFGPNRVGFGLHPQTWQGWLITTVLVAVISLITFMAVKSS